MKKVLSLVLALALVIGLAGFSASAEGEKIKLVGMCWGSTAQYEAQVAELFEAYERGKDYNHSTFCDLVLSGLLGIEKKDGILHSSPLIPDDWDFFFVTNLPNGGRVIFDRDGTHYGYGRGLLIFQ